MGKIAERLADYIIQKGTIKEEEREIYEYGFSIAIEVLLCVITCFSISMMLHTFVEGILFFVIFIPLRSYAGGLHLSSYWSCFSLSCLTFFIIMLLGKYLTLPIYIALITFFVLEIVIYNLYPVENVNREIDADEDNEFRKRLKQFLIMDGVLGFIFTVLSWSKYMQTFTFTLVMITVTMAIGKYKNNNTKPKIIFKIVPLLFFISHHSLLEKLFYLLV